MNREIVKGDVRDTKIFYIVERNIQKIMTVSLENSVRCKKLHRHNNIFN